MLTHTSVPSPWIAKIGLRHLVAYGVAVSITLVTAAAIVSVVRVAPVDPVPPPGLPSCAVAERPTTQSGYQDWAATLLDPAHALPATYRPPDLRQAVIRGQVVELRAFVHGPLREMLAAAQRDGVRIRVTSAFRSYEEQQQLVLASPGMDDVVARPGHSEHQLGTTVDLAGGADWLARNAPQFGFALSFPAARSPEMTCYSPEPWHYRYFGRQRAQQITDSGLSPREWLWADQANSAR